MTGITFGKLLRSNIREYSMYIALFIIFLFFTIMTGGTFVSPKNISDLVNQSGYIVVLAVGMTLVIVIRHIDLSVGYLAGFLGAVAATFLANGWPVFVVIPLTLVFGTVAGSITGFLVADIKIPAFVASLAGWSIYRGILVMVTSKAESGTIIIKDKVFNALSGGTIPDPFVNLLPALKGTLYPLTLLVGIAAFLIFTISDLRTRKSKKNYNFEVIPVPLYVLKLVFVGVLMGSIIVSFALNGGLTWTVVIILTVVILYHFMTTQTVLGRHIYAVGGNPEAAELSGISVRKITYFVFASMGFLSALAGILFASRSRSASPTGGTLFELDAIASAYIGGVSAAGGAGKIVGSLVGAIVYFALRNGMTLLSWDDSLQYILRGAILALFVIVDVQTRKRRG